MSGATPPSSTNLNAPWQRSHWIVVGLLLVLATSIGWWTRTPEIGIGGDEAIYTTLSHSLEHGRYHDEFLAGTPPHTKYPPGNPVWITLVRWVAGPDLAAVQAANLVLLALTALMLGDGVRRIAGPWVGVMAVGLTVLNALLLGLAGTVLSEPPYLALVVLALWAAQLADSKRGQGWVFVSSGAAVACFLTRLAGLTAIAGVGIWLLARRRWRHLAIHALVSLGAVAAWLYYSTAGRPSNTAATYARDLQHLPAAAQERPLGFAHHAVSQAGAYLRLLPETFSIPTVPGTPIDNLLWLAILGTAGAVGLASLSRKWPAMVAYLGLSAALLLSWPWPLERLLAPLIPAMAAVLLTGACLVARSRSTRVGVALPAAITAMLCLSGLQTYVQRDRNHRCDRADPYADPGCFNPEARGLVMAARFARDSLPPGTVVATIKPATIFYFSGHRTVPIEQLLGSEAETGTLALGSVGADIVLLSTLQQGRAVATMLGRHCHDLAVLATANPTAIVFGPRDRYRSRGDACHAVDEFTPQLSRLPHE